MTKREFQIIRRKLRKTQKEMGQLLGISTRAVQSFEQGWRRIPAAVERQAFFLYGLKIKVTGKVKNCWDYFKCSPPEKEKCPAWEFQAGHFCWFITGTLCEGNPFESWQKKMKMCRGCQVFRTIFPMSELRELA